MRTKTLPSPLKALFLILLSISCLALIAPGKAVALDGTAILSQVDKNLHPENYEMYRKLINIEPDGTKKEFVLSLTT